MSDEKELHIMHKLQDKLPEILDVPKSDMPEIAVNCNSFNGSFYEPKNHIY